MPVAASSGCTMPRIKHPVSFRTDLQGKHAELPRCSPKWLAEHSQIAVASSRACVPIGMQPKLLPGAVRMRSSLSKNRGLSSTHPGGHHSCFNCSSFRRRRGHRSPRRSFWLHSATITDTGASLV